MMRVEQIARVTYEVNRAYCESQGDHSFGPWEKAPGWQLAANIQGVEFMIANPGASPADSHESWLAQKRVDGWKYGPLKDAKKKEHPCYVPYDQLPPAQKAKDYIFLAIVRAIASCAP